LGAPRLNGLYGGVADFPRGDEIGFAHAQRNTVVKLGRDVEKAPYTAFRQVFYALIYKSVVVHGCTISLLVSGLSMTTPSILYFLRIKCVAVDSTLSMTDSFSLTKRAASRSVRPSTNTARS